jgi:hypothetical protein
MKSLKERLKDRAERKAKEEKKLSGRVKCFTVSLPWRGCPSIIKDSDWKYHAGKVEKLIKTIKARCAPEFYDLLKEGIKEEDRVQAELLKKRQEQWKEREPNPPDIFDERAEDMAMFNEPPEGTVDHVQPITRTVIDRQQDFNAPVIPMDLRIREGDPRFRIATEDDNYRFNYDDVFRRNVNEDDPRHER